MLRADFCGSLFDKDLLQGRDCVRANGSDPTVEPPLTLVLEPVNCTLDRDGYLLSPSQSREILLLATDNTDIDPQGWVYRVTFLVGNKAIIPSITLAAPAAP